MGQDATVELGSRDNLDDQHDHDESEHETELDLDLNELLEISQPEMKPQPSRLWGPLCKKGYSNSKVPSRFK